jgi:hypothetical protein
MTAAEEKADAKVAAEAKKPEEQAVKEAAAAAEAEAKAKAEAEAKATAEADVEAKAGVDAKAAEETAKAMANVIMVTAKYRDHEGKPTECVYSKEVHGDNFSELAEEFKKAKPEKV